MKTIIYKIEDDKVAVMLPAIVGQSVEELAEKYLKDKEYTILEEVNIDPEFQEAYEYKKDPNTETGKAVINYDKAKEIQKNKWREMRKPLLEKLDVDFMKALETNNTNQIKSIAEKKQELRDVTKISMINNLDAIKETMPNILKTL